MLKYLGALALALAAPAAAQEAVTVHGDKPAPKFDKRLFGQFAEHLGTGIYGGIWVGKDQQIPNVGGYRNDVLAALKAIKVPVVRWPGGCFADEYHWRDGIGPRSQAPGQDQHQLGRRHRGQRFGTHEFMDFAELIGAEAYVSGNVGSGTPQEMAEWVEYMTSPTGSTLAKERARERPRGSRGSCRISASATSCGAAAATCAPEYAADVTRRYATFVKAPDGHARHEDRERRQCRRL